MNGYGGIRHRDPASRCSPDSRARRSCSVEDAHVARLMVMEVQLGFKRMFQASAYTRQIILDNTSRPQSCSSGSLVIDAVTGTLMALGADRLPETLNVSINASCVSILLTWAGIADSYLQPALLHGARSQKRNCRRRLSTLTC